MPHYYSAPPPAALSLRPLQCSVTIDARQPLNVNVRQCDEQGLSLSVHGRGDATLTVRNGRFPITAGGRYRVFEGHEATITKAGGETLVIKLSLDGLTAIRVEMAGDS